jgi:RimJ/RimL family protein N-acetyltransferase
VIDLPDPPLSDGKILLREWRVEDVPALVRACADPLVQRYTSVRVPYTPEEARTLIAAGRNATTLPLAVVDAETGELLGATGLHAVDRGRGRTEIGYWTAPWARRRGVALGALRLLAAWAMADAPGLGLRRVELYAEPENLPSQQVAEAAGFIRGELVRGGIALRGRRRDVVRFVLERATTG